MRTRYQDKRARGAIPSLLALPEDALSVVVRGLFNPLRPCQLVTFACSCCVVHAYVQGELCKLRELHAAARMLSLKSGYSCRDMGEASVISCINKGIEPCDCSTLARISASGALSQLRDLDLTITQIGDSGLKSLAGVFSMGFLAQLRTLSLVAGNIGNSGLSSLLKALASGGLAKLEALNLAGNRIDDAGLSSFAESLSQGAMKLLEDLNLADNKMISDKGFQTFTKALSMGALALLEQLWLHGTQIGDPGMLFLSKALGKGAIAYLNILDLCNNQISDTGLKSLIDGLLTLPHLENVYLSGNQFGDPGMTALSHALGNGAMPSLQLLFAGTLGMKHPLLQSVCESRGINLKGNINYYSFI
eukprot:CAMPEP_0119298650 /NCGR_PEP_ID=MMETSP1333-20130426/814_1 /TAXON_ID=418940 /ORGANISM="Scyphosphaera apsteinii, Strain RCC1455" /LENGTH=361 /DNA_ID=CAMNT_0007299817 /DNA_START=76 /DNA_END=1161 /DNA_ORIENTATION=+